MDTVRAILLEKMTCATANQNNRKYTDSTPSISSQQSNRQWKIQEKC